jgi:hypothetical protein
MTGWAARRGRIGVPQPGGGAAEKISKKISQAVVKLIDRLDDSTILVGPARTSRSPWPSRRRRKS